MRSCAGSSAALAIVVGLLALPASAVAGPVEDIAQHVTEPVGQSVDRADAAVPTVRQVVERSTARVRPTVEAVTGREPIRSAVQSVTTSVDRAAPQAEPAVAGAVGQLEPGAPNGSSPSRHAVGHPDAGGIDRRASRRSGGAQDGTGGLANTGVPLPRAALDTSASASEQARSDASSTSASSDGGLDIGQPPFGFDGGGNALGGPAGIALMALLGLLAAMLTLIPRFSSRLLHMSPARWGLVAFLIPIERPG